MAFSTITTTVSSYVQDIPGNYQKSGTAFSAPPDHFQLTGGATVKGITRGKVVRQKYADVQVPGAAVGVTKRVAASASLLISVPASGGFTSTDVAAMVDELKQFLTSANVDRLMKGES